MPDRDLDITKFSYNSYRKFKKRLGEFDAIVECNEIAIREFIEMAQKGDSGKYIQELSSKHRVKVDEVDFIKFAPRIRQYYVSSVFQQSEQFINEFKIEYKSYHPSKDWSNLEDGQTKLDNLLLNVFESEENINSNLDSDLIECYNYYRLVRNYMAHTNRDTKDLNKLHSKVLRNNNVFLGQFHLTEQSNTINEINFDDFLILTNIVKHIAYILSTKSKPTNLRIAEILTNKSETKGLKKHKNKTDRYDNAIINLINLNFGRFSNKDIIEVKDNIKRLLA